MRKKRQRLLHILRRTKTRSKFSLILQPEGLILNPKDYSSTVRLCDEGCHAPPAAHVLLAYVCIVTHIRLRHRPFDGQLAPIRPENPKERLDEDAHAIPAAHMLHMQGDAPRATSCRHDCIRRAHAYRFRFAEAPYDGLQRPRRSCTASIASTREVRLQSRSVTVSAA